MKNLELTPLKRVKSLSRIKFAAADTESLNSKSTKFKCGSVCWEEKGGKEGKRLMLKTFYDQKDFYNFLSQFDVTYFYNLQYDSQYLRNYAFDSGEWEEFQITAGKGQRLLGISFWRKGTKGEDKFLVKDIIQFAEGGLADSAAEYGITEKKYPDIPSENKKDWVNFFDTASLQDITRHCEQDAKLTFLLVKAIRNEWFDLFTVDICSKRIYSLPSAAMKAFRVNFIKNPIPNPFFLIKKTKGFRPEIHVRAEMEAFCRQAYKGGYCNAEDTSLFRNLKAFDVVSEYPFAILAIRFPTGKATWTSNLNLFLEYSLHIPSIGRGTFYCEYPVTCGIREGKLVRLCGKFTETLTSLEIFTILRYGGHIINFEKGVLFSSYDTHNSLMRYEQKTIKIKCRSTGGRRVSSKKAANSIYGKTGQNYIQTSENYVYLNQDEIEDYLSQQTETQRISYFPRGAIAIETRPSESPKAFMNVVWAALITAFGRIYLLENGLKTNSIYYDTDSVKCIDVSPEFKVNIAREIPKNVTKEQKQALKYQQLGYFEEEKEFKVFRALAPKCYAGETISGERIVRIKGVPKDERVKMVDKILAGEIEISTDKYLKIMSSKESFLSKSYFEKSGIFGGIREVSKTLRPSKKPIYKDEMPEESI